MCVVVSEYRRRFFGCEILVFVFVFVFYCCLYVGEDVSVDDWLIVIVGKRYVVF